MSTSHGSSTGAPGFPTGLQDSRNEYNPATTGYNPATGAGYSKVSQEAQQPQQTTVPSNSYGTSVKSDNDQHPPVPPRTQRTEFGEEPTYAQGSKTAQVGGDLGKGVKGFAAGLHGAGESLRGAANAAVDRAFGSDESAEWNEEIARRGEYEIRSKDFAREPLPRHRE